MIKADKVPQALEAHLALYPGVMPKEQRLIFVDEQEKGVIVGEPHLGTFTWRVLGLYADHDTALALLHAFEDEAREAGALIAEILYDEKLQPFLKPLLIERGWLQPTVFIHRYHYETKLFGPDWFQKQYPLPEGFKEFPWSELTKHDENQLSHQLKGGTFPHSVYPLAYQEPIEFSNSLGLRYKGEVVGWMVNHRLDADTVRYSQFYIRDDLRHLGISVRLLQDSIKLQQATSIRWSVFEIQPGSTDKRWKRFVETRLAPYSLRQSSVYFSWKKL